MQEFKNIIMLSGGKDSTAMLLLMLEKKIKIDRIIFIDTTKEFPEIYSHLEKLKKYLKKYNLKIETASFDFDYFLLKIYNKKQKTNSGWGWPSMATRWCTGEKLKAKKRILGKDIKNSFFYIGLAFDEQKRIDKNKDSKNRYPLFDAKMTEQDALNYCYKKGFDFGGLYKQFSRVSCYCCPLSRIAELKNVYLYHPELWKKIKKMDEQSTSDFRSHRKIVEYEKRFELEKKQTELRF